ncbi:MAG: TetR/AcrR family transcriptional regulator [Acidimicrobiales bacterium]|nr:TetR/AcrR family transcriptional regulator [Acidimicrobiales bacterium]
MADTTEPAPPRRRQARADATRLALLDAAVHEFAAHGFEGATTRAIATRAGTHQPQINYHFASKDELWRAAVDHVFGKLDAALFAQLGDEATEGLDTREGFAALLRAIVRAVAGLPELNRIMMQEATADSERLAWIVEHQTRARYDLLAGAWRDLRARKLVADLDETVVYYALIGSASLAYVNAPEARRLLDRDPIDDGFVEAHAEAMVTMFLGPDPA